LNGRQRHTALVHSADVLVIGAESKGRLKILRHGTEVRGGSVAFVIPACDGKHGDFFEDVARIDGGEILFEVSVARVVPVVPVAFGVDDLEGSGRIGASDAYIVANGIKDERAAVTLHPFVA